MKYYVDTCVWIDFVEGEKYAEDFFFEAIRKKNIIIFSNLVFKEFVKHAKYSEINTLIAILKYNNLLEYLAYSNEQNLEAYQICGKLPHADALHSIISRDNDALLITRDKHFLAFRHICHVKFLQ